MKKVIVIGAGPGGYVAAIRQLRWAQRFFWLKKTKLGVRV